MQPVNLSDAEYAQLRKDLDEARRQVRGQMDRTRRMMDEMRERREFDTEDDEGDEERALFLLAGIGVVVLFLFFLAAICGCRAPGTPRMEAAPVVTPTIEPVTVQPEVTPTAAPEATIEAAEGSQVDFTALTEQVTALYEQVTNVQETVTSIDQRQGSIEDALDVTADSIGTLTSTVSSFDTSDNQLEARVQELREQGAQLADQRRMMMRVIIGLAGAVLIAAALTGPPEKWAVMGMAALGAGIIVAAAFVPLPL